MSPSSSRDNLKLSWRKACSPYVYWGMGALFYVYEMILRASTGVMGHDLRLSFGLSGQALGWLSSMYYWAYTPLQIPCGLLLDRIGTRVLLTFSCVLCASGAGIMAITESTAIAATARWGMGAGSACAFISCLALIHRWFSPTWFAVMMGVTSSLGSLGGILAGQPLAMAIRFLGWRGALMALCWIGVGLAALIWMVLPPAQADADGSVVGQSQQSQSPQLGKSNTDRQNQGEKRQKDTTLVSSIVEVLALVVALVKRPQMWLLGIIGGVLYLPFSAFAELWAISFIQTTYSIDTSTASNVPMILYALNGISGPLAGALAVKWGSYKRVLLCSALAEGLMFGAIAAAYWLPFELIVLASAALGMVMGGQVLVFSLAKEHAQPQHLGITHAFINTVIMGCGLIFQPLLGKILDISWHLCGGGKLTSGALVYTPVMYVMAIVTVSLSCIGAWLMVRQLCDLFPVAPERQVSENPVVTNTPSV